MTSLEILELPMQQPNDAGATTIRDYLKKLLSTLWDDGVCFSSKRPFGNRNWECDLYHALVLAGVVDGVITSDGLNYASVHTWKANKLVFEAIDAL